jgi:radical SAM superfamily enzyme YgiQ (UPF0313 family)
MKKSRTVEFLERMKAEGIEPTIVDGVRVWVRDEETPDDQETNPLPNKDLPPPDQVPIK